MRVALVCALLACLAAGSVALANSDLDDVHVSNAPAPAPAVANACSQVVLGALGDVAANVYREGVSSARTASALSMITHSVPLREAIERDEPRAARTVARTLIASGHMTNLKVISTGTGAGREAPGPLKDGGRVLADAGTSGALAPLRGSLLGATGAPIASFVASVWADAGFLDETNGIDEGLTVLRAHGHDIAGSLALPAGELPTQGELTVKGVSYRYTSFAAGAYPAGNPLRVYVFRSVSSIAPLCARTPTDTIVNTVSRVARLIYTGEIGASAREQIHRVQHNQPLLQAVAAREPEATRLAIDRLLNEHIVRIRVTVGGQLLSDVGGPHVLAPVRAPLRAGAKTIGNVVISIQDDLGYLLLAQRLAGLKVVMYSDPAHPQVVMSSFQVAPTRMPAEGPFRYQGHDYRVFTLHAEAFPSGPLRISVLIPIPYS
ncbi:MAG: hypothetical protein ACLP7W_08475 [Solirubrobacteraceae bacterium]